MVWIATPNIAALGRRLFGRDWYALDPPRHLTLFSRRGLMDLVQAAGFTRRRALRPTTDARWLFPPSAALARGLNPVEQQPSLSPGLRLRCGLAELASRVRPELAEELIVAAWKA
jgi:hypothetical protein